MSNPENDGASTPRVVYTLDQTADLLQVSLGTVYNLIRAGELQRVKIGRAARITHTELERFVAKLNDVS